MTKKTSTNNNMYKRKFQKLPPIPWTILVKHKINELENSVVSLKKEVIELMKTCENFKQNMSSKILGMQQTFMSDETKYFITNCLKTC